MLCLWKGEEDFSWNFYEPLCLDFSIQLYLQETHLPQ